MATGCCRRSGNSPSALRTSRTAWSSAEWILVIDARHQREEEFR
jgi:hypothetical protein